MSRKPMYVHDRGRVVIGRATSWVSCAVCVTMLATVPARAQAPRPATAETSAADLLDRFSSAVESMVQRVSPAVVQILATSYVAGTDSGRGEVAAGREQRVASGVILASDGYIVTNAHVVANALGIKVRLVPRGVQGIGGVLAQSYAPTLDATLVGTYAAADLALLKVAARSLPTLRIAAPGGLRQGQVVFAVGSPNGLQNSVTMGVVSSIARQLDPDSPFLYIQTDTPINPGNSGGPLVSSAGELVGLNTFISSQSGGNEGLGFAIPGPMVGWVYEQLRAHGHVSRPVIGAGFQTITSTMAAALELPRTSGLIVSDVLPGSPAEAAGLQLNDIVLAVGDQPMDNVAAWTGVSFQYAPGTTLALQVLRGTTTLKLVLTPLTRDEPSERLADAADVEQSQVDQLGIVAVTLDDRVTALIGPLRSDAGVVVVAHAAASGPGAVDLRPGDVVRAVNGLAVTSVDGLKAALAGAKTGNAMALLIERARQCFYLTFELP